MAKRGRPRKAGERSPCGKLRAAQEPEMPSVNVGAVALRDVVDGGQVVGRAWQVAHPMDAVSYNRTDGPSIDGDQWRALKAYADAWQACAASCRSALDMTPSGGGGIEAAFDARHGHSVRLEALSSALPPHLVSLVQMVCCRAVSPVYVAATHGLALAFVYKRLGEAGDALIAELPVRKAA